MDSFLTGQNRETRFFSFPFLIISTINITGVICTMADDNTAKLNEQLKDFRSLLPQLTGIPQPAITTKNRTHCPESQVPTLNEELSTRTNFDKDLCTV